jgi:hypothetical protein
MLPGLLQGGMDEDLFSAEVFGVGVGAALVACATRAVSASAADWRASLTGLTGGRCDTAATASDLDAASESEITPAEDESVLF